MWPHNANLCTQNINFSFFFECHVQASVESCAMMQTKPAATCLPDRRVNVHLKVNPGAVYYSVNAHGSPCKLKNV